MNALASILLRAGLVAVAIAVAIGVARPQDAAAHAVLERSLPVQNEKLTKAPELIETFYSEPLERSLTELEVLDTQGNAVHTGETQFSDDPKYAAIAAPPDLGPGIYTVTYQNVSTVDGHTWSGFFTFIVLNPDGSVPEGEALIPGGLSGQAGFLPEVGDTYFRWLALVAAVLLGGATIFYLLIARPAARFLGADARRLVEEGAMRAVAGVAVIAWLVLVTSEIGHLALLADRLGGPETLDDILLETRTGTLWLARQGLALATLLIFMPALMRDRWAAGSRATVACSLAALGGLGLLMTYSLGSHAEAGGGAFWAVSSDFVHFVATAAWLGTLVQLPLLFWWTRRRLEGAERLLYRANALDRFSWVAVVGVVLLIGTGIFNGFVQLPRLPALWDTTYGRVLIAKLALIIPLLGVAGINALFLKPALADAIGALYGRDTEPRSAARSEQRIEARLERLQRALPRTVIAEFLIGVAVLASVSVLAQSTTADGELRAQAAEPSGRFASSAPADDLGVELTIEPFGLGVNTFSVGLTPRPGTSAAVDNVIGVRLNAVFDDPAAPPSAGTTGTDLELEPTGGPGVWSAEAALLTQPGDWRIKALVRRSGPDVFDAETDFIQVSGVAAFLARRDVPDDLFDLPFTYVDWNIVAGGAMVTLGLGAVLIWRRRPPAWRRAFGTALAFSGVFAMMGGTVLLFGVHTHEAGIERNLPPEIAANPDSVFIGRDLFVNNCVVCHGPQGDGDGPAGLRLRVPPPPLTQHVPLHNDGTFFLWVSEGLPLEGQKVMPPFKSQLSEEERWHVVNYLRQVFGSGRYEPLAGEGALDQASTE